MNAPLVDTLHATADALPPPALEVTALVRAGRRRVARRRAGLAAGGAFAALTAAVAAPGLLPGGDDTVRDQAASPFATAFAAHTPTYTVGRTVHLGDRTFTVGHDIRAFVQTDVGIVYADPDGRVRTSDGVTESDVGRTAFRYDERVLATDGSIAAWVQQGPEPQLAVLDQATGEVELTPLSPRDTDPDDEFALAAAVHAVDGSTVYATDARGLLSVTGEDVQVLQGNRSGRDLELDDVQDGVFAYRVNLAAPGEEGDSIYRVGRSLDTGHRVDGYGNLGFLSPDGARLVVEVSDGVPAIVDTATGESLPMPSSSYDFQVGIGWVDDDTYAAMAIEDLGTGDEPAGGWSFDLLQCSVSESRCDVTRTDMHLTTGDSSIPIGADLNGG